MKCTKISKYKYVYPLRSSENNIYYQGVIWDKDEKRYRKKVFKIERDAAIWVDKTLIQIRREPVNILKRI